MKPGKYTTGELLVQARVHVAYLKSTLIPDLRVSGANCTADDFAECCRLIVRLSALVKGVEL